MKRIITLFIVLTSTLFPQDSQWVEQTVPFETGMLNAVTYVDPVLGWAVGRNDDNSTAAIIKTTNAGEEWILQESGLNGDLTSVYMINENTGYTVGQNYDNGYPAMLYTTDGGDNWQSVALPEIHGGLNDIKFIDEKKGIAVGDNLDDGTILIFYTTDGTTWQEASVPGIDAMLQTVTFSDDNTAFAVGTYWATEVPYIFRSTDGGATWAELSHPITTGSFMDVVFDEPDIGWILGSNLDELLILQTTNGGDDWYGVEIQYRNKKTLKISSTSAPEKKTAASILAAYQANPDDEMAKYAFFALIQANSTLLASFGITLDDFTAEETSTDEVPITTTGLKPEMGSQTDDTGTSLGSLEIIGLENEKPKVTKYWAWPFIITQNDCVIRIDMKQFEGKAKLSVSSILGNVLVINGWPTKIEIKDICKLIVSGYKGDSPILAEDIWLDLSELNKSNFPDIPIEIHSGYLQEQVTINGPFNLWTNVIYSDSHTWSQLGTNDDKTIIPQNSGESNREIEHEDAGGSDSYDFIERTDQPQHKKFSEMEIQSTSITRLKDFEGNDTLNFSQYNEPVTFDLDLMDVAQLISDDDTIIISGQFENYIGGFANDVIRVKPLNVTRFIDGGEGNGNDTLIVDCGDLEAVDDGTQITIEGYEPISYSNFEVVIISNTSAHIDEGHLAITTNGGNLAVGRDAEGYTLINGIRATDENGNFINADDVLNLEIHNSEDDNNTIDIVNVSSDNFPQLPPNDFTNQSITVLLGDGNEMVQSGGDLGATVFGGGGDDYIHFSSPDLTNVISLPWVVFDGGNGNDELKADFYLNNPKPILYLDGGEGDDNYNLVSLSAPANREGYQNYSNNIIKLTASDADTLTDESGSDTINLSGHNMKHHIHLDLTGEAQMVDETGWMIALKGQFENYKGGPSSDLVIAGPLNVARFIDGGQGEGDTLIVDCGGLEAVDDGTKITIAGFEPIEYNEIEHVVLLNVTSVEQEDLDVPTEFVLYQNYPNPFNPVTNIRYSLPVAGPSLEGPDKLRQGQHVLLKIYDILGNNVATLVNEIKKPGSYKVTFNAGSLSSGAYLYRLTAGEFKQTRKLLLIK